MDQVQIQIVQSQFIQRFLESSLGSFIAGIRDPQFCSDKQFFPGNSAFLDSPAYGLFISIGSRCINEPVAYGNGVQDCLFTLCRILDLKNSKAKLRHFYSII